jgi:hypothetical protein
MTRWGALPDPGACLFYFGLPCLVGLVGLVARSHRRSRRFLPVLVRR